MMKRILAAGAVGLSVVAHLVPIVGGWYLFPRIGGDDMGKPFGQLMIVIFTIWFGILAVADPIWATFFYRARRRKPESAASAVLWAAIASAAPPLMLMIAIVLLIAIGTWQTSVTSQRPW